MSKKIKYILITNIVINGILLLGFLWAIFCFAYYPLPERTKIYYMTPDMIAAGQGIAIISYETIFWFTVILLPFSIILSSILSSKVLLQYQYITHLNNNWLKLLLYIFGFFHILLGPLLAYFMLYFYNYINKNNAMNFESYGGYKKLKIKWNLLTTSAYSFIVAVPFIWLSYEQILMNNLYNQIPYRKKDLEDAWTISANKPNTIVLYFDRAMGLMFNELLAIDYLAFKDQGTSLAQLYPEFTSYINTISLAQCTNGSVPSIYGSFFSQPINKNKNEIHPINKKLQNNINNNDLTYDQWSLVSFLTKTKLLQQYGYKNITYQNIPYYDEFSAWSKWYRNANATKLENDLNSKLDDDVNLHVFDEREVAKVLGLNPIGSIFNIFNLFNFDLENFKQFASHYSNKLNVLNNEYGFNNLMNDNINLSISPTKDKTYLLMHQMLTHEIYSYVHSDIKDSFNDGINNANPSEGRVTYINRSDSSYWKSTWYTIQKIKNIFDYLKNLPYMGQYSNIIKNQYDNTTIFVISDHGNAFSDTVDLDKSHQYLIKNKLMNQKQANYIHDIAVNNEFPITNYNSVFAIKPRKYIHSLWNKSIDSINPLNNIYNNSSFISSADLLPIMDSYMQQEELDFISTNNNFIFDANKSFFANKQIEKEIILDPLNNEQALKKREIMSANCSPWKLYNDKNLEIDVVYSFKPITNIFDKNSWEKKWHK